MISDEAGNKAAEYSYDPWGRLRDPATGEPYSPAALLSPLGGVGGGVLFGRGYTGHEHLPWFGLINMNARLYDPILGRFLSPDPYVVNTGFSQDFNRYTYARNNPFLYTDQNGEFIHLIIGAAIGGILNLAFNINNISNFWQGLGYFGVGALAGAVSAGVGAGVSSMLPVSGAASGGFSAGFLGTSLATTATSSFISGAAIGGAAGLAGGFISGFGNGLIQGQSFGQALWSGAKSGIIGGATGALVGGISGGISAVRNGRDFWDGFDYQKTLDNAVLQEGTINPKSKWLVANKKNVKLVNDTYNTNIKVSGSKIYDVSSDTHYDGGLNIGSQRKGNITLMPKQVIRNKAFWDFTDVIRHEATHQMQVLNGMTDQVLMECGAYMANILNPATSTTIFKVFSVLATDYKLFGGFYGIP